MPETETVVQWLEEQYNEFLSVYDYGEYVRITNGSAAHYVDIYPQGATFALEGEKYGATINESCDATQDDLMELMTRIL